MDEQDEDVEFKELRDRLEYHCGLVPDSGACVTDSKCLHDSLGILKVLNARVKLLESAIDAGGWDMSPCGSCGIVIVCLPDGLPMCEKCAMESSQ